MGNRPPIRLGAGTQRDAGLLRGVGDADPYAPHAALAAALAKYPPRSPAEGVHVVQGMEHEVTETSVAKGLAFLSSLLRDTAPI